MLVLNIYVKPYLAEYARHKYPSPIKDVVQFPAASLVNHAIANSLIKRPANPVESKGMLDFDMFLHSYMDHERYQYGVDYKDSVQAFIKKYHLSGKVTPEALLKKHVRWKKKVMTWRTESVQLKMKFDK